jgi:hypothetical protein
VRNCSFTANAQPIWAWSVKGKDPNQNVTIENCNFQDNWVNGSGACLANQWSIFYVTGAVFARNAATKHGGVLYDDTRSTTLFRHTTFFDDNTGGSGSGTAVSMALAKGNVTVSDSVYVVRRRAEGSAPSVRAAFAGCVLQNLSVLVQQPHQLGGVAAKP